MIESYDKCKNMYTRHGILNAHTDFFSQIYELGMRKELHVLHCIFLHSQAANFSHVCCNSTESMN